MRNNHLLLAVALAAVTCSAQAETPTALRLIEIQSETAFVKAQTDLAKAKNDLVSAQGSSPAAKGLPQIVSIMRFGADISAKLRMDDGSQVEVRAKDVLSDGSRVIVIRSNGVQIVRGGATRELSFVSGEQSMSASSPMTGMAPMPTYGK